MRQQASYATLIFLCLSFTAFSNHVEKYINTYKDIAQREMRRSNIPASIILAQGIHESSWGRGELAVNSQNHFGIKCKDYWTGPTYYIEDDDYLNGKLIKSCFRAYDNVEDSYIDHTDFLVENDRYQGLFLYDRTDYRNWAKGLKRCGYATDPHYASKLIRIIETHQLHLFDLIEEVPVMEAPVFYIPGHFLNNQKTELPVFAVSEPSEVAANKYTFANEGNSITGASNFDYQVSVSSEQEEGGYENEIQSTTLHEEEYTAFSTVVYEASHDTRTMQNNEELIPNKTSGDKKIQNLSRKPRMSSPGGPR